MRLLVTLIAVVLASQSAPARSDETDLAKRRYETGKWLYEHGRYDEALVEFQAAMLASRRPQLDYNIGLCQEHLGHNNEAAEAYRRYVTALPDDPESVELRSRIAKLDAELVVALPASPRKSHRKLAIGLGATGLVLGGVGVALGSVVLATRGDGTVWDRNHAMAVTTDVFLPVGGALALAGLVVWLVDRKHEQRR